jgi:hypothetical protein
MRTRACLQNRAEIFRYDRGSRGGVLCDQVVLMLGQGRKLQFGDFMPIRRAAVTRHFGCNLSSSRRLEKEATVKGPQHTKAAALVDLFARQQPLADVLLGLWSRATPRLLSNAAIRKQQSFNCIVTAANDTFCKWRRINGCRVSGGTPKTAGATPTLPKNTRPPCDLRAAVSGSQDDSLS